MAEDYTRPASAFRFKAGTLDTITIPDAMGESSYPFLQNIRWYDQSSCRVRPGIEERFTTSSGTPILNISSYSTISTNNVPRYLASSDGNIYLDTGAIVDTGYSATRIPTMIPYRPNQSPESWMYIADGTQYRKLSAPDINTGAVTAQKVGIIEPQSAIDASPLNPNFIQIMGSGGAPWVVGGDAGGLTVGNRSTDTIVNAIQDPANPQRVSIQVGSSVQYQIGEIVALQRVTDYTNVPIQDVIAPMNSPITVQAAWNNSGFLLSEVWTIVPTQPSTFSSGSIYSENFISSIRRGSLVTISGVGGTPAIVTNVINGPDGSFCFTIQYNGPISTITPGATISSEPTVIVGINNFATDVIVGNAIVGDGTLLGGNVQSFAVTYASGVGTLTTSGSVINPFVFQNTSFQEDDYIHFSVKIDNLLNLIQGTIVFDVNNGSADYVSNAYYYSFAPNTIQQGISGNTTQLGIAQLVVQQNLIDAQIATESNNQGSTSAPAQTATGDNQWSEIWFNVSALTRIGNDQTRSLANTQGVRFIFDVLPGTTTNISISSVMTYGGGQVDVGEVGAPYQYIFRPRSSVTGAKGNPSPVMYYGVSPRRQNVILTLPATYPDSQVDIFDIYRFGGALSAYTFLGFVNVGTTSFTDIYPDDAIASSNQIEYDNYEPWPTIGIPISVQTDSPTPLTVSAIGNFIVIFLGSGSPAPSSGPLPNNLLPGNLIYINQTVFTTIARPYLFTMHGIPLDFHYQVVPIVENSGYLSDTQLSIYEPALANQQLPYMWGPDEFGGTIFAVGDPLRPGFVSFCKNFNPDSAPDSYNIELCPPSEPLLGGCLLNGNSYVFSTERCWFLRPSFGQANQYTPQEVSTGHGLAAPFGITTDSKVIYFISKDGIYITSGGAAQSLTQSLYNLFPHEGIEQEAYTYNGATIYPPDYKKVSTFKLNYNKGYLYFDFQDTQDNYRTLTFDTRSQGWCLDLYAQFVTYHYSIVPAEGSLPAPGGEYPLLLMGDSTGNIYHQVDDVNDNGSPIQCIVATREWTAGDERALKEWGDCSFDCLPTNANPLIVTPMSLGSPLIVGSTSFTGTARNQQGIVNLGGDFFSFSLGLFISWTQTYTSPEVSPVTLYIWQPSYINKPETISNRFTDWDNCGIMGAKYFQGYILELDTFGDAKSIAVKNNDTGIIQQTDTFTVNGQTEIAVSFETPFVAHMVRLEPQDTVDWKYYNIRWVFEPTPETVRHWQTQFSSLTAEAYTHVKELEVAYASTNTVTFTLSYDTNAQTYTLPSTGGVYTKAYLIMQPNKGKLYSFTFDAPAPGFSLWLDDCRLLAGSWGRASSYVSYAHFGGHRGDNAAI